MATDPTEILPTDEEPNAGSMKPVTREQVERMPGAGAPAESEAEGEGDGSADDASEDAARKMDERDQRI